MEICPEATSHNHALERIVKHLESRLKCNSKVLDIGAGEFCRHGFHFAEKGHDVDIVEVPNQIRSMDGSRLHENNIGIYANIPEKKYDAVLLNYVLNVLPSKKEREWMLSSAVRSSRNYLMVSVRNERFISFFCKNAEKYNDGYILERDGLKTFNIGYSEDGIIKFLQGHDLKIADYEKGGLDHRFICQVSPKNI